MMVIFRHSLPWLSVLPIASLAGDAKKLKQAWNPTARKVAGVSKICSIMFDERSVKLRKQRVRGIGTLKQIEFLHVVTKDAMTIPERDREHYLGTNKGDVIGPVVLPRWETTWGMSFADKKKLWDKHRVEVGGPTEGDNAESG